MDATLVGHRSIRSTLISVAAWSGIVGALMQIVLGIALAPHQNPSSPYFGLITGLNATSHLLILVSIGGLIRSGAAGRSGLGRLGLTLTVFGLVVLILAEPTSLIDMDIAIVFYSVSTLAIALGLILTGVAVLRTRRWSGWHRFTPLVCGLYVPLVLLPAFALPGLISNYAIGIWGVCWLLVATSLRAEAAPST